jgi:hypothetical protein
MQTTRRMKRLAAAGLAASLATTSLIATTSEADAFRGRRVGAGIAAGIIAGTVLGAYAYGTPRYYTHSYAAAPSCHPGPRQCDWAGRHCWISRFGERVCSGGEWRCWRPTVCD